MTPLYTRTEKPAADDRQKIEAILDHAKPVIHWRDITRHRSTHRISSWRALVVWLMNRHHGIPQQTLAGWLGLTHVHVNRLVRSMDDIIAGDAVETAHMRAVVRAVLKREERA